MSMTSPAEKMREAAAQLMESDDVAFASRHCLGQFIRAMPIPQEPPVEPMARALETAMDALADSQWSGGSAERRCAAALAEYEAWKKGAG